MATNSSPCFYAEEEEEGEYIDMDLSFAYCSQNSSPQSKDFEFQMSSICNDNGAITSSADELFYKGQLLPLHHPPRLQMVQNLLQTSSTTATASASASAAAFETSKQGFKEENHHKAVLITSSTNTSFSAVESCRLSCESNLPDENFLEWSAELSGFINKQHPKTCWSKKMKLIKQSILVQKLKASRTYLRSLFSKSACNLEAENLQKVEESSNDEYIEFTWQKPFKIIGESVIMKSIDKQGVGNNNNNNLRRRSFSGAFNRQSATKCSSFSSSGASSSSSSSFNSISFQELHFLKRSGSATEIECSIEAAIAHCKKSQQNSESRNNTSSNAAFCSM